MAPSPASGMELPGTCYDGHHAALRCGSAHSKSRAGGNVDTVAKASDFPARNMQACCMNASLPCGCMGSCRRPISAAATRVHACMSSKDGAESAQDVAACVLEAACLPATCAHTRGCEGPGRAEHHPVPAALQLLRSMAAVTACKMHACMAIRTQQVLPVDR